jgi:hypothetical protein
MNIITETANVALDENSQEWALRMEIQVVDFLSGYTVTGILEGFTPGEVTVLLPEVVTEQRAVTVHFDSFVFGGEVLYCRPKREGFEAHITIDDVEATGLRRSPRFPLRLPAQMFVPDADPVNVMISDVSCEGLGIELPMEVQFGQPIALVSGSVSIFGSVRYCCRTGQSGFRAGVEIQHLFERTAEAPSEEPRGGLLGKVFGKRVAAKRALAW